MTDKAWIDADALAALLDLFPVHRRGLARDTLVGDIKRYGSESVEAVVNRDPEAFGAASHALTGVLGNLGAARLGLILTYLKTRDTEARVEELETLRMGLKATLQALQGVAS